MSISFCDRGMRCSNEILITTTACRQKETAHVAVSAYTHAWHGIWRCVERRQNATSCCSPRTRESVQLRTRASVHSILLMFEESWLAILSVRLRLCNWAAHTRYRETGGREVFILGLPHALDREFRKHGDVGNTCKGIASHARQAGKHVGWYPMLSANSRPTGNACFSFGCSAATEYAPRTLSRKRCESVLTDIRKPPKES
jgi:hypothetical protein